MTRFVCVHRVVVLIDGDSRWSHDVSRLY